MTKRAAFQPNPHFFRYQLSVLGCILAVVLFALALVLQIFWYSTM